MSEIEHVKRPIPDDLESLLQACINTETWNESQALLTTNSEHLLSDEASAALIELSQIASQAGDEHTEVLVRHLAILEAARAESIDAAYADLLPPSPLIAAFNALWQANSPAQLQHVLNQHPVLLEEQTWQTLTALVKGMEQNGKAELAQAMQLRLDLLRDLRERQMQAAVAATKAC